VKVRRLKEQNLLVIRVISALMLAGMLLLVAELWRLQVPRKSGFVAEFVHQSVRRIRLPAVRGKIYDVNNVCLADSVPNYGIAIFTEELRAPRSAAANTLELIHELWSGIDRKPDISYRDIKRHLALTPDEPLTVWTNLTDDEIIGVHRVVDRLTAPLKGSTRKRKIVGLDEEQPVTGRAVVFNMAKLRRKRTSIAANTLELVYIISQRIGIPPEITFQKIKDHIFARRPLPLIAWKNIGGKTMARWAETCSDLTAADIFCMPDRYYPEGENFAHLIGYTGLADEICKEGNENIHYDLRGLKGRKGLEAIYNLLLEGKPGIRLVQIDASGFYYRDLQFNPPVPGGDLQLSVDANIQHFAAEALAMRQPGEDPNLPVRGACVVLDPNNGDVLAMVSSPSFDPNRYPRDRNYFRAVQTDKTLPAFHRAVFGQYPPGSTFKPIVALAALKKYPDYGETIHECVNPYYVGKHRMRCWIHNRGGAHGSINLRQALMYSCNVYMFETAQEIGYDPIHDMAQQFGIGQFAGLYPDLEGRSVGRKPKYGNLPDKAANAIDLCNMAIGQGAITVSPLQMAMVAAAIANGGTLYRPRLVKKWRRSPDEPFRENPTSIIRRIDLPMEAFELVRGGMYDVVQDQNGTAKKARVSGVEIAGKTGSAQYPKGYDKEKKRTIYGVDAWMISFAPFDFPRYAVAMLVEDGVSGGSTVGPRLSALYKKIFEYDGTLRKEKN